MTTWMDFLPHDLARYVPPALVLSLFTALWRKRHRLLWYAAIIWDRTKLVEAANEWMLQAQHEARWGTYWKSQADRCQAELDRRAASRTPEDAGPDSGDAST